MYSKYKYVQPGGSATGKVQLVCCISALFNLTHNSFFLNFILFFNFIVLVLPYIEMNLPQVWYGEGGGRRVQDGEHMYT